MNTMLRYLRVAMFGGWSVAAVWAAEPSVDVAEPSVAPALLPGHVVGHAPSDGGTNAVVRPAAVWSCAGYEVVVSARGYVPVQVHDPFESASVPDADGAAGTDMGPSPRGGAGRDSRLGMPMPGRRLGRGSLLGWDLDDEEDDMEDDVAHVLDAPVVDMPEIEDMADLTSWGWLGADVLAAERAAQAPRESVDSFYGEIDRSGYGAIPGFDLGIRGAGARPAPGRRGFYQEPVRPAAGNAWSTFGRGVTLEDESSEF